MTDTPTSGLGPGLAVLLGVVEGLTEFLPVSSTGHLILVSHLVGFTGVVADNIEISIQLGAMLAIVVYEWRKITSLFSQAFFEQKAAMEGVRKAGWKGLRRVKDAYPHLRFLIGLAGAFLPAALLGLVAHRWIEAYLFTPAAVAAALITGGVVIWIVEGRRSPARLFLLEEVGLLPALLVGFAQCFSLFPGVSRSGATIVGGLLAGMDRKLATEYSFFLALPTLFAASGYKLLKSVDLLTAHDAMALGLGLVASFLVAWAVIATFLAFVKRHSLRIFAIYRIALGMIVMGVME